MLDRYLIAIRWRGFCFFLAGLIIALFNILTSPTAQAEGSRSLYPASYPTTCGTGSGQGCRANLDLQSGTTTNPNRYVNKVRRSTFLYVYAQAGEYILLGSSNIGANYDNGDVFIYNPNPTNPQNFGTPGDENYNAATPGSPDFKCSTGPTPTNTQRLYKNQ